MVVKLVPAARVGAATEGRVVAALHGAEVVHHAVQVVLVVTVPGLRGGGVNDQAVVNCDGGVEGYFTTKVTWPLANQHYNRCALFSK